MNPSQMPQYSAYDDYRKRSEQFSTFQNPHSQQRTHLPTPPVDDFRARYASSRHQQAPLTDTRPSGYQLPRPFQTSMEDRRPSNGYSFNSQSPMMAPMQDSQVDPRRGSADQQFVMVPTYLPMYQQGNGQSEQWQNFNQAPQGAPWPYGNPYQMQGYGLVQRPLPPAPMGPVEKPKRRRAPPAPQYLHMTVQEMIEELAYREVDTQAMQARKAKKAEYIDQLQKADREGKLGRGAWKSCHGDVPPISKPST